MGGGGGGSTTSTTSTSTVNTNVTGGAQTAIGGGSNIEINAAKGITTGGVYFQQLPTNQSSGSSAMIQSAGSYVGSPAAATAVPTASSAGSNLTAAGLFSSANLPWLVGGAAALAALVGFGAALLRGKKK